MDYTETYDNHHKTKGLEGSGSGNLEDKLEMIERAGLRGSCLDYGCGWGQMSVFDDYVGVDISKTAIEYATEINPGKKFYVIRNGELDLIRRFDFAIALSVLTHADDEDVEKILRDIFSHTDVALIDIIHGDGGDWRLHRRMPSVFGTRRYEEIGRIITKYGIEHTFYKVNLGGK